MIDSALQKRKKKFLFLFEEKFTGVTNKTNGDPEHWGRLCLVGVIYLQQTPTIKSDLIRDSDFFIRKAKMIVHSWLTHAPRTMKDGFFLYAYKKLTI